MFANLINAELKHEYTKIISSKYIDKTAAIQIYACEKKAAVKKGCFLSPLLVNLFEEKILKNINNKRNNNKYKNIKGKMQNGNKI